VGEWRRALHDADVAVIVGFSMSDFDAMAQMQFAEVARDRQNQGRLLPVIAIDPFSTEEAKERFRRVFRSVDLLNAAMRNSSGRPFEAEGCGPQITQNHGPPVEPGAQ